MKISYKGATPEQWAKMEKEEIKIVPTAFAGEYTYLKKGRGGKFMPLDFASYSSARRFMHFRSEKHGEKHWEIKRHRNLSTGEWGRWMVILELPVSPLRTIMPESVDFQI